METIRLNVGTVENFNGRVQECLRPVEFVGEELVERTAFGYSDRTGGPTDTRGTTCTLYRAEGGRLVVHVHDWSRWQGEPTTYSLRQVCEADLGPNGDFELLGAEAGFGRALTLDEALREEGEE